MEDELEINSSNDVGTASKSQLKKEAIKYREDLEKRGVVYLSRIPPFMKPNKARVLFENFGEVTRLYLAEESSDSRKKRKLSGGNAAKQFTEGWVEFADKKIAKQVAESLNNTSISGKKGDFYHDDLWNLKYLKNFKWDYLTEKFAYERRIRETKLKHAMIEEKKKNAEFAELVEKSTTQKHIVERKRKRAAANGDGGDVSVDESRFPLKTFRQREALAEEHGEKEAKIFDTDLIKSIFTKSKKLKTKN